MNIPAITTNHVRKVIDGTTIIPDISLNVPRGSIYGFLGENGAGKTTTIRLILGLIKPTSGTIEIAGQRLSTAHRSVLAHVGSLVEGPSLYGHLSGVDNLRIAALLQRVSEERITEVLDIVGLSDAGDKLTSHYSLGMKQRLGIAIALLHQPSLLILDEPTNGLDPAGIKDLRRLIISFQRDYGMTVFLSSHLLSEIEQVATHIGVIHHGQLLFEGTKESLQAQNHPRLSLTTPAIDKAQRVIEKLGITPSVHNGQLIIQPGSDEKTADIVAELVASAVPVHELRRIDNNLEHIFMQLTHRQEQ
mgnify:FL=1